MQISKDLEGGAGRGCSRLNEKPPKFPDAADGGFAGFCEWFLLSHWNLILPTVGSLCPTEPSSLHSSARCHDRGLKEQLCLWESLPQLVPEIDTASHRYAHLAATHNY